MRYEHEGDLEDILEMIRCDAARDRSPDIVEALDDLIFRVRCERKLANRPSDVVH